MAILGKGVVRGAGILVVYILAAVTFASVSLNMKFSRQTSQALVIIPFAIALDFS